MSEPRPILGVSTALWRGDDLLLVLRGRAPFLDLWSLPGGRVEFGETLEAAARRELREETGLAADRLRFVRPHEGIEPDAGVHVVVAVFTGEAPAGLDPVAADDAADVRFVDPAAFGRLVTEGRTTAGLADVVAAARALGREASADAARRAPTDPSRR